MANYTQTPGLLNIKGVVGADFSCNLDFTISLVGYTFDAGIVLQEYPSKIVQPITVAVNNAASGLISLSLTDSETSAIGPISNKKWYLNWEVGSTKNTIISGRFELSDIPIGQETENGNDVIVQTPEVTVTLTSLTGAAVNINAVNDTTSNASFYPVFVGSVGSGQTAKVSTTKLSFNPSTGNLNATEFTGNFTGNLTGIASNSAASTAIATTATTTNQNFVIPFVSNSTSQAAETLRVAPSITFNPSTNTLSAPAFSGSLVGTASSANSALTATINDNNSANREFFPVFAYQSAGAATTLYGSSTKLKFNPSNGYFTASAFTSGDITVVGSGLYWTDDLILSLEENIINDYNGNAVAYWGNGNGMYVTGTASKDVPLRLVDNTAGNLSTGSYIIVRPSASATTNGTELRNAYAAAKAFTPNSLALSATNRATVLLLPGRYDLGTTPLTMDTEFVDLVGLSEEPKHVFITSQVILSDSGTIVQTADNVVIRNVSIDRTGTPAGSGAGRTAAYFPNRNSTSISSWTSNGTTATITSDGHGLQQGDSVRITGSGNTSFDGAYTVTNVIDLNSFSFASTVNDSGSIGTATERFDDTYIENCRFGGESTASGIRISVEYAGTYRRCDAGSNSWGSVGSIASGTFVDCICGFGSFGYNGTASGTFTNCTSGEGSFGGYFGTASGTFTNCTSGELSFGTLGTASGTFTNCTGGNTSFGSYGTASGTFTNCTSGGSFSGYGTASGTFTNCTGGDNSFGSYGTASGTFTNCTGGNASFGYNGTASGTFTNCTGTEFSFGYGGTASGVFTECSVINSGSYSGTFTGTMRRCRFVTTGTNASALQVGAGAKIFDSTLIATGTGNSITAASAVTISLAGCRMNKDINANVSNNLGTLTESYNLIDADID